jgi:hypothetical protein
MHAARRRGTWRCVVALSAALTLVVLVPFSGVANATTKANVAAFCRAETYIARYDANGATVFGVKGVPLKWPNVTAEKLELTALDEAQASAARSAPTNQLASYSRTMSTQFVPWLEDVALVNYEVHHKGVVKKTKTEMAVVAALNNAAQIMESHSFTDPVEHYCPALRPPASATSSSAPHLTNYPSYDTTPVAVQVGSFISEVSFGDELNDELTAFANPSLSHLRKVLANHDTGQVHATFVGTPKSYGGPKSLYGEYFWDIRYRVGLHGHFFTVHIHLYRPNDANRDTVDGELSSDPLKIISFTANQ